MDKVTVIQADREAAADLLLAQDMVANDGADWVRAGHLDHGPSVQAFAKHRLATPAPDSEKLREAIRGEVINSPETADFMAGVPLEAAHQRDRWAVSHDAGKTPFDWFWLIGYLSRKAADAAVRGDAEKAKHHTISTAAALANWHAHLTGADTRMRPGIDPAALGASL